MKQFNEMLHLGNARKWGGNEREYVEESGAWQPLGRCRGHVRKFHAGRDREGHFGRVREGDKRDPQQLLLSVLVRRSQPAEEAGIYTYEQRINISNLL